MICSDKQKDSCETCIHNAVCVMKPDIAELRKQCDEIADQIRIAASKFVSGLRSLRIVYGSSHPEESS